MYSVSILIPTYNRSKFNQLIINNITSQTYPLIKEIIIADDGDERLVVDIQELSHLSILYYKVPRMTIGEKRNFLKDKASGSYLVHMDTDDLYHPEYISNCVFNLLLTNKDLSGSSDMILYTGSDCYKQCCIYLNYINEATMAYTKKYANEHDFKNSNSGEGVNFCYVKDIVETPIEDIMICLCHSSNTINKKVWLDEKYKISYDLKAYENHLKILSNIII